METGKRYIIKTIGICEVVGFDKGTAKIESDDTGFVQELIRKADTRELKELHKKISDLQAEVRTWIGIAKIGAAEYATISKVYPNPKEALSFFINEYTKGG